MIHSISAATRRLNIAFYNLLNPLLVNIKTFNLTKTYMLILFQIVTIPLHSSGSFKIKIGIGSLTMSELVALESIPRKLIFPLV